MMDNTNYLLELDVLSCSSGFDKKNDFNIPKAALQITCFCCLATNVPVVNASKCNHTEFVKLYLKKSHASGLWICCICHYMLKKIELFRYQVEKSFNVLRKKVPEGESNCKLVNDLMKRNSITILSIVKPEHIVNKDPLEDTNKDKQKDIEIKHEPDYDSDTNSISNNISRSEQSIQTFTHTTNTPTFTTHTRTDIQTNEPTFTTHTNTEKDIETNIPMFTIHTNTDIHTNEFRSCDTSGITHTETSQNLKLMKIVNLPPKTQQMKENPLLKTMLCSEGPFSVKNYIKILPKADSSQKSKGQNSVLQDSYVDDELVATQERRGQILVAAKKTVDAQGKQDDKVYSLLHRPSSVIDSRYEGKIMQHTITQELLDKQREVERNKEAFKIAKYKCNSCVKVFNYEFEMDRHNARQHKKPNLKVETVCTICNCVYSKSTYKNHFKQHFTRFVCVVCYEDSTDLPKLALHFNQSHPEKEPIPLSYWCNDCDFKTDAVFKYTQHRKSHRRQRCNICNKIIYVKMRIHMKSHHSDAKKRPKEPNKSYKCEHCPQTYVIPSTLRIHVRTCHSEDTNTYYCRQCDKQFKTEAILRLHLTKSSAHASVEEVFKYICDFCGKKTKYKNAMESHIEREHLKTGRFKCEPCNKIFGSDRVLERHINFVHNKHKLPKNKICQYCGKAFAGVATLRTHIRKHTGERPLKCDICDKTFAHNGSLFTHRRLKHKIPTRRELKALQNEN